MRKGTGTIAWVAWVFLMITLTYQCGNPLGPSYQPHHHLLELSVVGATLYIFSTYFVARAVSQRTLVRALFGAVGLFTITVVTWFVYHSHHGEAPMVQDWDGYTRVTPFHEQLAVPVFVGLAGGIAVLAFALRKTPPPTLGPLTS
jgi:multidrug transporter EmrE-like cation transporter